LAEVFSDPCDQFDSLLKKVLVLISGKKRFYGTSTEYTVTAVAADLEFLKAPEHNGCPVTTIYDPVAGNYEQADWRQMEIIRRIPLFTNICDLAGDIEQNTTLRFSLDEIAAFIQGLINKGLTRSTSTKPLEQLRAEKAQRDVGLFKKMIHSYLYFRIPLIRPDRFLEYSLPFVSIFASRLAFIIYAIAACFGCYGLLMRFDEYVNTLPRFFSFDGIFIYSVIIICLKLVHEFAHSYTAKHYGVRIPTMGAAFIVMWPVAFRQQPHRAQLYVKEPEVQLIHLHMRRQQVI